MLVAAGNVGKNWKVCCYSWEEGWAREQSTRIGVSRCGCYSQPCHWFAVWSKASHFTVIYRMNLRMSGLGDDGNRNLLLPFHNFFKAFRVANSKNTKTLDYIRDGFKNQDFKNTVGILLAFCTLNFLGMSSQFCSAFCNHRSLKVTFSNESFCLHISKGAEAFK